MPMYAWLDTVSQKKVDIIRRSDDYQQPPTRDDISPKEMTDAEVEAAQWEPVQNAPSFVRGPSWRGSKGYW